MLVKHAQDLEEFKLINEKRAEVYWWLSSLLAQELTDEQIEQYNSLEVRGFLNALAEHEGLTKEIGQFIAQLNRLDQRTDKQLELAADFCDAFLKSEKDSALPYASVYLSRSGLLNQEPAEEMERRLADFGVQVSPSLKEPADHVAIMLDLLGNIILKSNQAEDEGVLMAERAAQIDFIESQLMTWIPRFAKRCAELDGFGFYAATCQLLERYLLVDLEYLSSQSAH